MCPFKNLYLIGHTTSSRTNAPSPSEREPANKRSGLTPGSLDRGRFFQRFNEHNARNEGLLRGFCKTYDGGGCRRKVRRTPNPPHPTPGGRAGARAPAGSVGSSGAGAARPFFNLDGDFFQRTQTRAAHPARRPAKIHVLTQTGGADTQRHKAFHPRARGLSTGGFHLAESTSSLLQPHQTRKGVRSQTCLRQGSSHG